MELKGAKINFLGDSITFGYGTMPGERFSDLLETHYGVISRNYGECGTRIARQQTPSLERAFDRDFCMRVAEMNPDADVIVVFGGTNDFGHGDAPIGSSLDRTPDTFYGALHTLYTSLLTRYPQARIVVLTPMHRTNEGHPRGDGNKKTDTGTLDDYVGIIRTVARSYSLPVLDLHAQSGIQPKVAAIAERFMPDGLHPNAAGHKRLAQQLAAFLRTLE